METRLGFPNRSDLLHSPLPHFCVNNKEVTDRTFAATCKKAQIRLPVCAVSHTDNKRPASYQRSPHNTQASNPKRHINLVDGTSHYIQNSSLSDQPAPPAPPKYHFFKASTFTPTHARFCEHTQTP